MLSRAYMALRGFLRRVDLALGTWLARRLGLLATGLPGGARAMMRATATMGVRVYRAKEDRWENVGQMRLPDRMAEALTRLMEG